MANTVAALTDIHNAAVISGAADDTFQITSGVLNKLLIALNECSEWGRVAILSALARYATEDERESEHICERVVPQFQHANASVVLAAVKVCDNDCSFFLIIFIIDLGYHDPYTQRSI